MFQVKKQKDKKQHHELLQVSATERKASVHHIEIMEKMKNAQKYFSTFCNVLDTLDLDL